MLAFHFVALEQYGSGKKIGLPKNVGQTTVSSVLVAAVHCAALIVPFGEWTAKCALSQSNGSLVVEPGSFHVPAVQVVAVAGQLVAQVVVVLPGSQLPAPPTLLLPPAALLPAALLMPASPALGLAPAAPGFEPPALPALPSEPLAPALLLALPALLDAPALLNAAPPAPSLAPFGD